MNNEHFAIQVRLYFDSLDEFEVYESFEGFQTQEEALAFSHYINNTEDSDFFDVYRSDEALYAEVCLAAYEGDKLNYSERLNEIVSNVEQPVSSRRVSGYQYAPDIDLSDFAEQMDTYLNQLSDFRFKPYALKRLKLLCYGIQQSFKCDMADAADETIKMKMRRFYSRYETILNKAIDKCTDTLACGILEGCKKGMNASE